MEVIQIHVIVLFCEKEIDVGWCDTNWHSLANLINDILQKVYNRKKHDDENIIVKVIVPWSSEKISLQTDQKYLDVVSSMM